LNPETREAISTTRAAVLGAIEGKKLHGARYMKNALLNKLNAVIASIEAGNYSDALGQVDTATRSAEDDRAEFRKWPLQPPAGPGVNLPKRGEKLATL
jgi:hypothetical protein